jgi:hypothetical protein
MPASDSITLQEVVTGILVPVVIAGFWILWRRGDETRAVADKGASEAKAAVDDLSKRDKQDRDEIGSALGAERHKLQQHQVECERRFARVEDLQRLEEKIEDRFDRLDVKLDRALARA